MSIYHKEQAEYFNRAMQSIWDEQSIKPNEIVLVQDGKLTDELYKVIEHWKKKIGDIFKTIPLKQNVGTGKAKNIGLQKCTYELIAIMDTDDVCSPDRFEKQLKVFKGSDIDVCSSWVSEFEDNENNIISFRKLPQNHDEIVKFAKSRMPVNHPATMYKKDLAIKAEGYKHMLWFEDYYLMVRMIKNGAKFYNIQEPLVNMRAGYGQLERRSGLKYIQAEFRFFKTICNLGFINKTEFILNILLRSMARVMPKKILKQIYKRLRA
jgi:glycosyltransferase involved in cell wall biosynthesis